MQQQSALPWLRSSIWGKQGGRQNHTSPPQTLGCGASRMGTFQLTGALPLLGSQAEQTEEHQQVQNCWQQAKAGFLCNHNCIYMGWLVVPRLLNKNNPENLGSHRKVCPISHPKMLAPAKIGKLCEMLQLV